LLKISGSEPAFFRISLPMADLIADVPLQIREREREREREKENVWPEIWMDISNR